MLNHWISLAVMLVSLLLKFLDSIPPQADPYGMALDRSMLDHLRANVAVSYTHLTLPTTVFV